MSYPRSLRCVLPAVCAPGKQASLALVLVSLMLVSLAASARARETVELIPEDRSSWGATNVFAPVTGLFMGGPGYWYSERKIEIDTTPPGAVLDLFYVRANFQKAYEQAEAPITLVLPSRIEAGPRDSITIRALLDGYRQEEVHVKVRSRQEKVDLTLEALPNLLEAMTHTYFSGRGSLGFLTKEPLNFRVQKASDGFSVVLTETGQTPAAKATMEGVASSQIQSLQGHQLGEDLVVRVKLTDEARGNVDLRQRQGFDPVRGLHEFSVDMLPSDGGASAVQNALDGLARIQRSDVSGCALDFDHSLREQLEPGALNRALSPSGSFLDPYLRGALKRLGELTPDGVLELTDGTTYKAAVPIELSAAATQSADVVGYLALLRAFVDELEVAPFRRNTLRGLVAPEVGVEEFEAIMDRAEASERGCAGGRATAENPPAPSPTS